MSNKNHLTRRRNLDNAELFPLSGNHGDEC